MEIARIIVEGLEKKYRYFRLWIPALVFEKGVNLVVGPNGSGKSTLLKILAGFTYPSKGRVLVEWSNGSREEARNLYRYMGFVGEDIRLPNLKVKALLELFAESTREAESVAERLGLLDHLGKKYYSLSSGYKRRVQLAIALLKKPSILVLDEPFANLDIFMIKPLEEMLEQLGEKMIVVITSHIGVEIPVATITILDQGNLVYHGKPPSLEPKLRVEIEGSTHAIPISALNKLIAPIKIIGVEEKGFLAILEELLGGKKKEGNSSQPK